MQNHSAPHKTEHHSTLKRRLGLAYIIGLHLFVVVLLVKTDFASKFKEKFLDTPKHSNPHGETMILFHQAMDASVPEGASIFIGDSITQGLATAAVSPFPVNYGIGSATTTELLENIPKYQSLKRASVIFLMIGINDIGQNNPEALATRLVAIDAALPNNVPLVWSGIMPAYRNNVDPTSITSANRVIRDLCAARVGCTYVDTQKLFSAGGPKLFRDGVHPNNDGYAIWIDALRKAYQYISHQKPLNKAMPEPISEPSTTQVN
jgi:hypothetical protein